LRQGYGVVDARQAVSLARHETHQLEMVGCGPPRIENGKVLFFFHDDHASSVSLACDFNSWDGQRTTLQLDGHGLWRVDGERWVEDPNNGMKAPDNYGGLNSVLVIK
ncbi:MAG: hypothetical protein ABR568_24020, partial [Pyrinomonadaceae bacterium]